MSYGKFGGNSDPELAARLWDISLDGMCDDQVGDVDTGGWFGRIGRHVLRTDSQGFVDIVEDECTDEIWGWYVAREASNECWCYACEPRAAIGTLTHER